MEGFSIWKLLIIVGIVVLIFGTRKLRNLGGDMGSAVNSFKKSMDAEKKSDTDTSSDTVEHQRPPIEGETLNQDEQSQSRK